MSEKVSKKAAIRTPFSDAIAKKSGGLGSPAPAYEAKVSKGSSKKMKY